MLCSWKWFSLLPFLSSQTRRAPFSSFLRFSPGAILRRFSTSLLISSSRFSAFDFLFFRSFLYLLGLNPYCFDTIIYHFASFTLVSANSLCKYTHFTPSGVSVFVYSNLQTLHPSWGEGSMVSPGAPFWERKTVACYLGAQGYCLVA